MREKNNNSNCGGGRESPCINRYGRYLTGGNTDTYIRIYHSCIIKKKQTSISKFTNQFE